MTAVITEALGTAPTPGPVAGWTAPRVDLLPPEVVGRRAVRRVQRGTAVAAAAAAVCVAAVWLLGHSAAGSAQADLDAANGRVQALQAQQAEYAAAPQTIAQLQAARAAQTTVMAQDVAWYSYVDTLTRALPAGAWLVSVQTALDTTAATAAAGATTTGATTAGTAAAGIGSVTISAKSTSYDDVAAYLDALDRLPGVWGAYLTTSSSDDSQGTAVVSFSVTAVVTPDALSHRFDSTDGSVG